MFKVNNKDTRTTPLQQAFKHCSNFERYHQGIDKLKIIFKNNGYRKSFVDICIKTYLGTVHKILIKKTNLKISKREPICVLFYIGKKVTVIETSFR